MTREELLQRVYLNKKQIQALFEISRRASDRIYSAAMQIDREEMKFPPFNNMVKLKSVLKVQGISFKELERQIKSAPSLGGQSTTAD